MAEIDTSKIPTGAFRDVTQANAEVTRLLAGRHNRMPNLSDIDQLNVRIGHLRAKEVVGKKMADIRHERNLNAASVRVIETRPVLKYYNVHEANDRIKSLEQQLGMQAGPFIYRIGPANARIDELAALVEARASAPAAPVAAEPEAPAVAQVRPPTLPVTIHSPPPGQHGYKTADQRLKEHREAALAAIPAAVVAAPAVASRPGYKTADQCIREWKAANPLGYDVEQRRADLLAARAKCRPESADFRIITIRLAELPAAK